MCSLAREGVGLDGEETIGVEDVLSCEGSQEHKHQGKLCAPTFSWAPGNSPFRVQRLAEEAEFLSEGVVFATDISRGLVTGVPHAGLYMWTSNDGWRCENIAINTLLFC